MKKRIVKVIFFFLLLMLIGSVVENVLKTPKNIEWNTEGMKNIKKSSNHYDVIFSGTSMALTNISVEELYLKYGIAGMSIGEPEQMVFLSYYALENTLKYQSPKVVLFDTQALFYSEESQKQRIEENEEYYVHTTLDDIDDIKIKYEAVQQVKELHPTSNYAEYFSVLYHNHANWENISQNNFIKKQGKDIILGNRNIAGILENVTNAEYISEADNTGIKDSIPQINEIYLKKMSDLCKEKNIDLVLIRSCGSKNWSWGQYNTVVELADELNIKYLDLAVNENEIEFNWRTDTFDGNHHNVCGTKKWTDFLGRYLDENYYFADKKNDRAYEEYEVYKEKYEDILNTMRTKIELISAINFNQYLDTLLNLDKEGIAIFISIYDDASMNFSLISQHYLSALGLNVDLMGKYRYSYYGILDNGKNIEELCNEEGGTKAGILDSGAEFEISSGGALSDVGSSIKINGIEYAQNGRGINIVVYDKKTDEILSSVYFDTFAEDNPTACRIKNGVKQEETDVNVWKDAE